MAEAKKSTVRVLAVLGSPHAEGNSAVLLNRAIEGVRAAAAEAGAEAVVESVVLATKQIKACPYCAGCHRKVAGGACIVKDDMQAIYEQILSADIVLHSVPIWFWSMPGLAKGYLDRWTCFFTSDWAPRPDIEPRLRGKVMGALAVCGDTDHEHTCAPAINIFKSTAEFGDLFAWAGSVTASANDRGEVAKDAAAMDRAFALGRRSVELCTKKK